MNFRLLFLFILVPYLALTQCPTSNNIRFFQQEDLDSFLINYPNCTEYEGTIEINICINLVNNDQFGEFSIYDLSPLSNLTSLEGISIHPVSACWYNKPFVKELNSIYGLHNLSRLNYFSLGSGIPIYSLSELSQIGELEYLSLNHTSLNSVDFDVTITKFLDLSHNDDLNDISRISLAENIEGLSIFYNDRIKEAPSLLGAKSIDQLELGSMDDVSFLSSVEEIKSLEFVSVEVEPDIFQNLKIIGDIKLIDDESLPDFNLFSHVNFNGTRLELQDCIFTSLDGLNILQNGNLDVIKLTGLPIESLNQITDAVNTTELILSNLDKIVSMPNLERLTKLKRLWLESMNLLESIASLNVTDSLWQLQLNDLPLSSLEGLETLKSCEALTITRLNELESLDGLNNLISLGELFISRNDNLNNIYTLINCSNFFSTNYNAKIDISRNDNLVSIDGIANWRGNWNNINITNNPNLAECSIPPLCDSYGTNTWIVVNNNMEGCNSDEEVKENCGYKFYMVYLDLNENGIKESDESGLPLGSLESNNGFAFYPNLSGLGDYNNSGGISSLEYRTPENWALTSIESIIDLSAPQPDTIFFGISPEISFLDYDVFLSNGPVICDRNYSVFLNIENEGTESISGTIQLDLPGDFWYASVGTAEQISDQIVVTINEPIVPGEIRQVELYMLSPSVQEQSLDSLLNFYIDAELSSSDNESLTLNKHYTSSFYCAYDPNDKQVFPVGIYEENYTLLETKYFQYTIRFQNTGNFPATDILIRDTLDASLDPSSLKVRGASHSRFTIERQGSSVEFRFDNIFLPDSVNNEPQSHGFLTFTVDLYSDVSPDTEITNEAHIYFDSNPAIVTNKTLNTMVEELPVSGIFAKSKSYGFDVWPIPVVTNLNIYLKNKAGDIWGIYNTAGSLIETGDANSINFQIDVSSYPSGVYFIKIGEGFEKFIKT